MEPVDAIGIGDGGGDQGSLAVVEVDSDTANPFFAIVLLTILIKVLPYQVAK